MYRYRQLTDEVSIPFQCYVFHLYVGVRAGGGIGRNCKLLTQLPRYIVTRFYRCDTGRFIQLSQDILILKVETQHF